MQSRACTSLLPLVLLAMCGCDPPNDAVLAAPQTNPLAGSHWDLKTLTFNGVTLQPPAGCKPTLSATPTELTGNAGCNRFFGSYTAKNGRLQLKELAITEMGCPFLNFESSYCGALTSVDRYQLGNGKLTLSSTGSGNQLVFVTHRPNHLPLMGAEWRLTHFTQSDGVTDSAMRVEGKLTLAIAKSEASGDEQEAGAIASGVGGCNSFQASVTVGSNKIQFGPLAATKKACGGSVMKQEAKYFGALQEMTSYQINGNTLTLSNADTTMGLQFEGVEVEAEAQQPPAAN